MDVKEILSKCDHTLLNPAATFDEIQALCDDALKYGTASVCIPACYVKAAKEYTGGRVAICTVIGADEIDMVINIGLLKAGEYDAVLDEIKAVKAACGGKLLKVIIETCLLTDEEKIKMCEIVSKSGADYIKTSTGFSKGGATFEDVALFAKHVAPHLKIKAAGGISSLEDAEKFIALGASRLGTSRVVKAVKEKEND